MYYANDAKVGYQIPTQERVPSMRIMLKYIPSLSYLNMINKSSDVRQKNKTEVYSRLVALSLIAASIIFIGSSVMPSEMVNGQNATNATGQMENASAIDQVETEVLESLASPRFC